MISYKRYKKIQSNGTIWGWIKYNILPYLKMLYRIPYCTYMCIRYPFLYPRYRFTGKHRVNLLYRSINRLHNQSRQEIAITGTLAKEKPKYLYKQQAFFNYRIKLNVENKTLKISNEIDSQLFKLDSLMWCDDRFEIVDLKITFGMCGNPIILVYLKPKDENDNTKYGFSYYRIKLTTNKRKYRWFKIIKWIDEKVLDRILFLPTCTEWDVMPAGWNKAFGKQYLKDLKKQLKKDKMLYKFRILDLKEKYGTLRFNYNYGSQELYDIISNYESLSWHTCIQCGKPATHTSKGWIAPYCTECVNNSKDPSSFILRGSEKQ